MTDTLSPPRRAESPAADSCACSVLHEEALALAREGQLPKDSLRELGELFKVFGDPTRLGILFALAKTELCVCDLGALLGMSQSAVSHQLAGLRAARLVRSRREGKVVYYALDDAHVGAILQVGLDHVGERGGER